MIENVILKVFKPDGYTGENRESPPIQDICTNIKLYSTFKNICTELQFTIAYDYDDYNWYNFEIGDEVVLWYQSLKVFYGKITDSEFNEKSNTYSFVCYDFSWWLAKNNISYNFDNISAFSAVNLALKDVMLSDKYCLADESWKNIMLGSHLIKNKSTKDVLQAIMSSVTKITGKYYYIHMSYYSGLIQITEADKYYSGMTIQASSGNSVVDGNLIDYTITRSMQNMINKVQIYDKDYNPIANETAGVVNLGRYGTIQDSIVLDDVLDSDESSPSGNSYVDFARAQDQAKKKIENYGQPSEEVIVKCIGDINYRVGYGVMVKLPDSYFYDRFMYIVGSEWEWTKDGKFISTLSLSNSNKHELTEWEDIEEIKDVDASGTGGDSQSVEAAVQWMIQIANDNTHGYDQNNRWGPDYDCSSLVISGYQQAGIQLKTNGASYTGDMKTAALKTGFIEVQWGRDMSKLQRGDILLNEAHHVACYIGDGKMVSAHQNENGHVVGGKTGDQSKHEIDISNYSDYPWDCVLRYKTQESTSSSASNKVSSKLIEFIKGWEAFEPTVKDDGYGNPTLGYGMTGAEIGGRTSITESEASKWLQEHVNTDYAVPVYNLVQSAGIALPQNKFDVLVDMGYNMGAKSNEVKKIINMVKNGSTDDDICSTLMTFNHANGAVSNGLTKRCKARCNMWKNGVYDSTH